MQFLSSSSLRFLEERHFQIQLLNKRLIEDLGFSKLGFVLGASCGTLVLLLKFWPLSSWSHLLTSRCIYILKRDLLDPPVKSHCITAVSLSWRIKINLKTVTDHVSLTVQHAMYTICLHNMHTSSLSKVLCILIRNEHKQAFQDCPIDNWFIIAFYRIAHQKSVIKSSPESTMQAIRNKLLLLLYAYKDMCLFV